MKIINNISFYAYCLFLVLIGGVLGLLVPKWGPLSFEVYATTIFKTNIDHESMASALNQYRFMKSVEFGFGLFGLLFRQEIYTQKKFNYFFLGIMLLGTLERILSYFVDGKPRPAYIFFIFLELSIWLIILLYSRVTLKNKRL
ncbi:DUF4345 family protein [Pedobacter sp. L105]|uniref:DUF4345 family protein n=1 Tax=Pedobacter sp. L105 TaxID=1641871 RepID=UPI00131DD355|nr:DUF4345 family protein [Pedobacter sp. L105]